MVPDNITKNHINAALAEIDQIGVQNGAHSSTYDLIHNGKRYPPKLVISLANKFANGEELPRDTFYGGPAHPAFKLLEKEGFEIVLKNDGEKVEDVKQEFAKWLLDNAPESYDYYLGKSINSVIERLEEINSYFTDTDLFRIINNDPESIISFIKINIAKKSTRLNNEAFLEYDLKHSNGIPKAVIGKNNYLKFLDEKFSLNLKTEEKYWIFQGSPEIYDIERALREGHLKTWKVAAHTDKIKIGNKVILWQTGQSAGCYALAEIISEVGNIQEEDFEKQYYKIAEDTEPSLRVKIKITTNLVDNPVLWEGVKELPEFDDFNAGNQGTNFSATKEEFETIEALGGARGKSFYWEVKKLFPPEKVEIFLSILRNYLIKHNIDPKDDRLSFNVRPDKNRLVFIIGSRYALSIEKKKNQTECSFTGTKPITEKTGNFVNHKGEIEAYWNIADDLNNYSELIEEGFNQELKRQNKSPFRKYSNQEFINDIFKMKEEMMTIHLNGNSVYKLSMGKFLKDGNLKQHNLVEYFEENLLGVMDRNTKKGQGEKFREELKPNDLVYITYGQDKLGNLCKVIGGAEELNLEINDRIGDTNHLARKLEVLAGPRIDNTRSLVEDRRDWLPSGNSTLTQIPNLQEANEILFSPFYGVRITRNGELENLINPNTDKEKKTTVALNQILYGPPGTGKTYRTKELAVQIANPEFSVSSNLSAQEKRELIVNEYDDLFDAGQIVFTTFHQSFSYEDFIEGIKPIPPKPDGEIGYEVMDGIFKKFCIKASEGKKSFNFDEAYEKYVEDVIEAGTIELETPVQKRKFNVRINSNETSVAFPQTEKATEMGVTKEMLRDYIINGVVRDWKPYTTSIGSYLVSNYGIKVENIDNSKKNHVLVIDEINRGNVSAILGELITLLEADKRKNEQEEIIVELPYSKEPFSVPSNVYIIGTMNTADRSVEALDTALRRRFSFTEIMPLPELLEEIKFEKFNLCDVLTTINQRIEALLDRDHTIGHSYFIKINSGDTLELTQAFENKVIPLLQEYFYHDYEKIALILGEGFIKHKQSTVKFANFKNLEQPELNGSFELKAIEDIEDAIMILLNNKDEE